MEPINHVPAQYQGAAQLENLAFNKNISDEAKVRELGVQFESIITKQFLDEALKPLLKNMGKNVPGGDIYNSMIIERMAEQISRDGGMGVSSVFEQQIKGMLGNGVSLTPDEKPMNLAPKLSHPALKPEEEPTAE